MFDVSAHRKDRPAALAAAFVLLLQALLTSWSFAAPLHNAGLDAFGNELCITSSGHGDALPGQSGKGLDCCTLSCNLQAVALPQPTPGSVAIRFIPTASLLAFSFEAMAPKPRPEHAAGSPRSPPPTA